jgi:lipoate-protein ligase A
VRVQGDMGFKVSGSAYKISKDIAYHHGTMLLSSNLEDLRRALKIRGRIMLRDKGVDSVRANHVANVSFPGTNNEEKFEEFAKVVKQEFDEMHGETEYLELKEEDVVVIPEVKKNVEQLSVKVGQDMTDGRAGIGSLDKRPSL